MKKKFDDIKVGEKYEMTSPQFDNANNKVICIAEDVTGLGRRIKYFIYEGSMKRVPTEKEFSEALKDGATSFSDNFTIKDYNRVLFNKRILQNVFAIWDFQIDGGNPTTILI